MRALIICPEIASRERDSGGRSGAARMEEAAGLARAIRLEVADALALTLRSPRPATLLGAGKVEEVGDRVRAAGAGLVIVDHPLSPVQQRNLEKAWQCKVIDRTALILEIFGERARTREGKLQVELASLSYQKGRLVRSWTHLERQRGGFGFLGGPGESQIETDRRLIGERIAKIRKALETVTRTRELHRKTRREVPYPLIALAGYTNAGKSTLFNRLTGAAVKAEDALFATLDPTMRALRLPSGVSVILSDTVGFVSNLPTELVAAFRATLEEVVEADLVLHVRDIAHPDTELQKCDVEQVLSGLMGEAEMRERTLDVWNKADLLDGVGERRGHPGEDSRREDIPVISALTGEGCAALLRTLDARIADRFHCTRTFALAPADREGIAWLHRHGAVLDSGAAEDGTLYLTVRLSRDNLARFEKR